MTEIRKIEGIAYERSGRAPAALLFIHGFLEDRTMWDGFIRRVAGYSVIAMDLPGFGDSAALKKPSISAYADAAKKVLDNEGIKKVLPVGHSMGGYTAMAFAKKYGEMLQGLCLFHSHPYADSAEIRKKREKGIRFVASHGVRAYAQTTIPNLFAPKFRQRHPEVVARIADVAAGQPEEGVTGALRAMKNRKDTSEVLTALECPVQFIIGTEDAAIPHELSLKQTVLPKIADVRLLKGVGHMGHLEARRKTQKALREFFDFCR